MSSNPTHSGVGLNGLPDHGSTPLSLLTKQQAADRFQVSTRTLDRWRAAGLLPAFRVGQTIRFRLADLERFLAKKVKG